MGFFSRKPKRPLLSFLMPIEGDLGDSSALERSINNCLASLTAQTLDDFELCVAVDGQATESVDRALPKPSDRIRITRRVSQKGRAVGLDDALRLSEGRFVARLDWSDQLAPTTVKVLADEISCAEDIDLLFTDEDELDDGTRTRPFFKPGFSLERLRQQMYTGGLVVCRRSVANEIGGFVNATPGAEDYDFTLRASERARRVVHIPKVLYHRSNHQERVGMQEIVATALAQETAAQSARVQAVAQHLKRTSFPATAKANSNSTAVVDLEPSPTSQSTVSIVIPTGGTAGPVRGSETLLVTNAIRSVVARSTHRSYEFVVVLDRTATKALAQQVRNSAGDRPITIVHDTREFNFSKACNLGAVRSSGDVLVFLNDDTEVRSPDWLERLTMYATRSDIGAVGAKLLYGNDRIQQVGIWARHGHPLHRYVGYHHDDPGNKDCLLTAQNCIAVTAACLAVEKKKFMAVGGFTPIFPLSYNDVDLCLKLARHEFRTVVDGATTLYHFEAMSRDPFSSDAELETLHRRWEVALRADPYDNPNHRTEGVEELPLPSDSSFLENEEKTNYLGRHWPSLTAALKC